MSLSKRDIFRICQLKDIGYTQRQIARETGLSRPTVKRYLINPCPEPRKGLHRSSLLEPYYSLIEGYLAKNNKVSAVVIYQRLTEKGYLGGLTILRNYLRKLRPEQKPQRAYIRFESASGEQCQIDWGYFGTIQYGKDLRKVWCFVMIECYSRLLYLEFTHSCNLDVFIGCHINAFNFFGGVPRELVFDNAKTMVIERDGALIRFNERYLDFLRPLHIVPHACNPYQAHEKGKVEKGGIHYVRYNFWPLRTFCGIHDLNSQAVKWRDEIANMRIHRTTREKPAVRFKQVELRPFMKGCLDPREMKLKRVSSDCRISFDCNRYSVPYWTVGKEVVLKADNHTVTIYYKERIIARHQRVWEKYKPVNNPHHEKQLLENKRKALASKQQEYFLSLGPVAQQYLSALAKTNLPLKKNIFSLLNLKDIYGPAALISACKTALKHNTLGTEYIENILLQQKQPRENYLPVIMKKKEYNDLLITEADLAFYDNLIFQNQTKGD